MPGLSSGSTPGIDHAQPASTAAASTDTALNTASGLSTVAAPPSTGPEQHAHDRGAERSADQLAAALRGRGGHEPRHSGGPHAGSADALDEARGVEQDDVLGEREREARDSPSIASPASASA